MAQMDPSDGDREFPNAVSAWVVTTAILSLVVMLHVADRPFVLFSLGGSCVILFGMPSNPMAQPRSLVGGHLVGAITGIVFVHVFGDGVAVMSSAVATTLMVMMLTRTIHSPAGATPLIAISTHADWFFILDPVAVGLAILLLGAVCYQRAWLGAQYPSTWV